MRQKYYNASAQRYAEKIRKLGYTIKFNWSDPYGGTYEDVTVRGPRYNGYGTEFSTPREAYYALTH